MEEDQIDDEAEGLEEDASRGDEALVKRWIKTVQDDKAFHEPAFRRMRMSMDFLRGKQWPYQREDDDRYVANLAHKVVKTRVAALYAKNPTVIASRKPRLDFAVWDEKPGSLQEALQSIVMSAQASAPMDPHALRLLADVRQGMERRTMIENIGRTLVACYNHFTGEQRPGFKKQMKQMVRRASTTCVGYVKLGYQRLGEVRPDVEDSISDMVAQLAHIERLSNDIRDGDKGEGADTLEADARELELAIETLRAQGTVITREGLVWHFPRSTRVIPDRNCVQLDGWIGAEHLTEEFEMTVNEIREVYGADVSKQHTGIDRKTVSAGGQSSADWSRVSGHSETSNPGSVKCYVWEVYDRPSGNMYVVCEGHDKFLIPPAAPDVSVENFFPIYPLTFNEVEHETELFPPSDVELLMHPQREYNRSKEALRQHRIANRPLYGLMGGTLEEDEKASMATHEAHDVIEITNVGDAKKIDDVLAPIGKAPIDPNVYETNSTFEDIQRVVGASEANFQSISGGTATETSISESSRLSDLSSSTDDIDELLGQLARDGSQILLLNLPKEKAREIAGVGAVWPEFSREEIYNELFLSIEAGSSGRPNKAQEIANFERLAPVLLQVEGITPRWLAKRLVQILDDRVDLTEALTEGIPSITALNRMVAAASAAGPGPAPGNAPEDQGGAGGDNAPVEAQSASGPQPDYGAAQALTPDGLS